MQELDDIALLREYERGSEEAFATLVTRHINKVYSVALRHTNNPHQAEEITQAVFVILAKRFRHLDKRVILSGWLYQTARLAAVTFIRSEIRRARREQEAHMQSALNEDESEVWAQIAPLLDEAMAGLNETDRHAVVLRFFDGKSLREVGAAIGATESAATMRLNRALEKLQKFFFKRGVTSTTARIAETISIKSVQVAPVALAKTTIAVALAKGATASASTLTLIKGALKVMAWTKAKTAVAIGVAVILTIGATTITVRQFAPVSVEDVFVHYDSSRYLQKAPAVDLLRPTKYANQGSWMNGSSDTRVLGLNLLDMVGVRGHLRSSSSDTRILGRNIPMKWVLAEAYGFSAGRMILPPDLPPGGFDYLVTASSDPAAALQDELKKQFGLVAHTETITTNVLVLKVNGSTGSGLKMDPGTGNDRSILANNSDFRLGHYPMPDLADALGGDYLNIPIVDETGLKGSYDARLRWNGNLNGGDRLDAINQALQNQLGLQLVPDERPIQMLVVECQDGPSDYTPRAGSDLQGYWEGTEFWGGKPWPVVLKITEPSAGQFRALFRNVWFNPDFVTASSVTYDSPKVHVEFPEPARVFEGEINSSHTEIQGRLNYTGTNYHNASYPMTVKLTDPQAAAARDAQKDYSYTDVNDLVGHWKATLDNSQWALDIAHLSGGKISASLTLPGWNDGIENTFIKNGPQVRIEWGYGRMATFMGKIENGELTGTLRQGRQGKPQPISFERSVN